MISITEIKKLISTYDKSTDSQEKAALAVQIAESYFTVSNESRFPNQSAEALAKCKLWGDRLLTDHNNPEFNIKLAKQLWNNKDRNPDYISQSAEIFNQVYKNYIKDRPQGQQLDAYRAILLDLTYYLSKQENQTLLNANAELKMFVEMQKAIIASEISKINLETISLEMTYGQSENPLEKVALAKQIANNYLTLMQLDPTQAEQNFEQCKRWGNILLTMHRDSEINIKIGKYLLASKEPKNVSESAEIFTRVYELHAKPLHSRNIEATTRMIKDLTTYLNQPENRAFLQSNNDLKRHVEQHSPSHVDKRVDVPVGQNIRSLDKKIDVVPDVRHKDMEEIKKLITAYNSHSNLAEKEKIARDIVGKYNYMVSYTTEYEDISEWIKWQNILKSHDPAYRNNVFQQSLNRALEHNHVSHNYASMSESNKSHFRSLLYLIERSIVNIILEQIPTKSLKVLLEDLQTNFDSDTSLAKNFTIGQDVPALNTPPNRSKDLVNKLLLLIELEKQRDLIIKNLTLNSGSNEEKIKWVNVFKTGEKEKLQITGKDNSENVYDKTTAIKMLGQTLAQLKSQIADGTITRNEQIYSNLAPVVEGVRDISKSKGLGMSEVAKGMSEVLNSFPKQKETHRYGAQ